MADPTQIPKAAAEGAVKAPKTAAKGLAGIFKGKPLWMWIAGFTVLAGVAYLTFTSRTDPATLEGEQQDGLADEEFADYGPEAAGPLGGGTYVMPSPTQGAFGGFDTPDQSGEAPLPNGADPGDTIVNIYGPRSLDDEHVPTEPGPVTGGGPPRRPSARSHHKPKKKPRKHAPVRKKTRGHHKPKKKPKHAATRHRPKRRQPATHTPARRRRRR